MSCLQLWRSLVTVFQINYYSIVHQGSHVSFLQRGGGGGVQGTILDQGQKLVQGQNLARGKIYVFCC